MPLTRQIAPRTPKKRLIYAVALFIFAAIGVAAAKALWSAAVPVSAMHPATDSDQGTDADYVQGLAKRGIVKLPGYEPPPLFPSIQPPP